MNVTNLSVPYVFVNMMKDSAISRAEREVLYTILWCLNIKVHTFLRIWGDTTILDQKSLSNAFLNP